MCLDVMCLDVMCLNVMWLDVIRPIAVGPDDRRPPQRADFRSVRRWPVYFMKLERSAQNGRCRGCDVGAFVMLMYLTQVQRTVV